MGAFADFAVSDAILASALAPRTRVFVHFSNPSSFAVEVRVFTSKSALTAGTRGQLAPWLNLDKAIVTARCCEYVPP